MYGGEVEGGYLPWLLSPFSPEVRSPTESQSSPIQLVISQLALRNTLPLCEFENYVQLAMPTQNATGAEAQTLLLARFPH